MFMKDFLKWLGVNEKVAKVAIWLFIIMVCLIVINTALDSLGLPYYKITVDNLVQADFGKVFNYILSWIIILFNFYSVIFIVFRTKEFKKILPYSLIYLVLDILIRQVSNYMVSQIFIIAFILGFCYFYSGKKIKYIIYGIYSIIFNVFIQFIWFSYKASSLNINELNASTRTILTFDFFIIMTVIIIAKEIYMKKRSERICGAEEKVYSGSENSKKKATLPRK